MQRIRARNPQMICYRNSEESGFEECVWTESYVSVLHDGGQTKTQTKVIPIPYRRSWLGISSAAILDFCTK